MKSKIGRMENSDGLTGRARGTEALNVETKISEVPGQAENGTETATLANSGRVLRLLVLGVVLLISGVYVGLHSSNGWVPADEGTLSQSALRVMGGELPHRDFVEIYTGGLSVIHAFAFRVLGVNLMSLRICVFLFFLVWLAAAYYIALRFASPIGAGLIVLTAVAWSFPNYPAAMPSWYNLFFATFGAAALLRYLDARRPRWLIVAGICGGISILIKVIGAYYVAAVLLFLAFMEQDEHESEAPGYRALPYRLFSGGALLLFLMAVVYLFHARLGLGELYEFVLPASVLVGLTLMLECRVRSAGTRARFCALLRLVGPFLTGVALPIIVFLVPYALSGGLNAFFAGVTGSAVARSVGLSVIRPVGAERCLYALTLLAVVAGGMYRREFQGKIMGTVFGLGFAVLLICSTQPIVSGVWFSAATLTPLVVLSGAAVLVIGAKSDCLTKIERQQVMLLISLAGLCSFVQFPFAAPIYLSYSLPLTLLAAAAIVATAKRRPGTYVLGSLLGFYLLFGVVDLVPNYIYELTHKVGPLEELPVARAGGLRIEFAPGFARVVHLIQQHSPNGLLYAGNDCPEFYFLSGTKNVTQNDGGARPEEVLQALQTSDVKVVVINEAPFFPGAGVSPEVRQEVMRRFPESELVGIFRIFWRQ